jgi:ribosomal protein L11 methyltransferase
MDEVAQATTRGCLELLAGLRPGGPLVDLGCGTGILAVTAARLGFGPVQAVDIRPEAVLATLAAAARTGVELDCRLVDLLAMPAPFAPVVCADVPEHVHAAIAAGMPDWPDYVIASGFAAERLEAVADRYARLGLAPGRTIEEGRSIACLFSVDGR